MLPNRAARESFQTPTVARRWQPGNLKWAPHRAALVVETTAAQFLRALLLASLEPVLVSPLDEPQAPCSRPWRMHQRALGEPKRASAQQRPVVQRSAQMAQQQVRQAMYARQLAALQQQPVARA